MSKHAFDSQSLAAALAPLFAAGELPLAAIGLPAQAMLELGFEIIDDRVRIPRGVERLDESLIREGLNQRAGRWLSDLEVLEVVGSTNSLLSQMAMNRSVHGTVRLAELQVQGRGRRGRTWMSPYANNLALSLGVCLPQTPDRMGGFSLCVGLAVADMLQTLGVTGVALKWPNDVLLGDRKIAGILVELHRAAAGTEAVVGVGVNFHLPEASRAGIDQPVTDLRSTGLGISRNEAAACLISSLVDFTAGFADQGFAPMVGAFNAAHRYHDQRCTLHLGRDPINGKVRGVTEQGELLLEVDGRVESYAAGEVSLRPI